MAASLATISFLVSFLSKIDVWACLGLICRQGRGGGYWTGNKCEEINWKVGSRNDLRHLSVCLSVCLSVIWDSDVAAVLQLPSSIHSAVLGQLVQ